MDIGEGAFTATLNSLANTIVSMDVADSALESAEFIETIRQIMVEAGKPNLVDYFPVLKRMDPQGAKRRMTRYFRWMFSVFDRIIDKRLEVKDVSDRKNDMLDTLLELCEDEKEDLDLFQMKHLFLVSLILSAFIFFLYKNNFFLIKFVQKHLCSASLNEEEKDVRWFVHRFF